MKYILITGANGGLASVLIIDLLKKGEFVIGLDISSEEKQIPDDLKDLYLGLIVDITNDDSIIKAVNEIKKITNKIDVIINTAGIMTFGSMIEESPEVMKKMIEVNFLGMYRINYYFLPMLLKNSGRIINFSSEYGTYKTIPFNGFYTITKHAVEAYSDGLRRELKYLGVKVVIIRPGAFKTNMQKSIYQVFDRIIGNTKYYKKPLTRLHGMLNIGSKNALDSCVLSKVVQKGIYKKNPKLVYKKNHNLGIKILSILPNKLIDFIFYHLFK